MMHNLRYKKAILVTLLIIGLNIGDFFAIGATVAYFNDMETSGENAFGAGSLDFSLTKTDFDFSIGLAEKIDFSSILTNSGTVGFVYDVKVEKISGSDMFCGALELETERNGIEIYDNSLTLFELAASSIIGTFDFETKLPFSASGVSHGEECEVDFVFRGWQPEFSYPNGFIDEERINIKFTSRMIALNEFLPNPEGEAYGFDFGNDSSDMPQGEWVEIYNNSDTDTDVAGWYLRDSTSGEGNKTSINVEHILAASPALPAQGWLVVYINKPIYNNTGDTVRLFDDSDNLIDSYTYTGGPDYCEIEPTPGDENFDTTTGDCGGVPPNKSYARIPDGIGGWVDPIPTPGGMNRLSEVKEASNTQNVGFSIGNIAADDADTFDVPFSVEELSVIEIQTTDDAPSGDEINEISVKSQEAASTDAVIEEGEKEANNEIAPAEEDEITEKTVVNTEKENIAKNEQMDVSEDEIAVRKEDAAAEEQQTEAVVEKESVISTIEKEPAVQDETATTS